MNHVSVDGIGRIDVVDMMDFKMIPTWVEVTCHDDPCRKYIRGIPDEQSITFNMNWMTQNEVRALERLPSRCLYCGSKRRLDGLGQCVGCGAPE